MTVFVFGLFLASQVGGWETGGQLMRSACINIISEMLRYIGRGPLDTVFLLALQDDFYAEEGVRDGREG